MRIIEGWLRRILDTIVAVPLLFWSCVVANMVGVIAGGIFWYGPVLWSSPLWALPFIPDCPLAALVGTIALLGAWSRQRWRLLFAFAAFGCLKYGVWTMAFWLYYWSHAGNLDIVSVTMFVSHIGLSIEGLLFVPHIRPLSLPTRGAVVGWFVLSLFVDYGLGYHPPLGGYVPVSFVFWLAVALTATLGGALLLPPFGQAAAATRDR
ncbi:MAG: DUF1405 domain-containing protein [Chloroflexaceae bacterium]|nr:DUF1405 domain-containing protein [Chloroflexaceae bacterium]